MVIHSAIRVLFETLIGTHEKVEFEVEKIVHATMYRILLIIHNEKLLLFHASLPLFFTCRNLPKTFAVAKQSTKTRKVFTANNTQYMVNHN